MHTHMNTRTHTHTSVRWYCIQSHTSRTRPHTHTCSHTHTLTHSHTHINIKHSFRLLVLSLSLSLSLVFSLSLSCSLALSFLFSLSLYSSLSRSLSHHPALLNSSLALILSLHTLMHSAVGWLASVPSMRAAGASANDATGSGGRHEADNGEGVRALVAGDPGWAHTVKRCVRTWKLHNYSSNQLHNYNFTIILHVSKSYAVYLHADLMKGSSCTHCDMFWCTHSHMYTHTHTQGFGVWVEAGDGESGTGDDSTKTKADTRNFEVSCSKACGWCQNPRIQTGLLWCTGCFLCLFFSPFLWYFFSFFFFTLLMFAVSWYRFLLI